MTNKDKLNHAMWLLMEPYIHRYLMSNAVGREDGVKKALNHQKLCEIYIACELCIDPQDSHGVDDGDYFEAVHEKTQQLTGYLDEKIGFPLTARPNYKSLSPRFFEEFIKLAETNEGLSQ